MSLVATLICNPNNPALDSTVVDGARAILRNAGSARWLWDEVAADIPFESDEPVPAIVQRLQAGREDLPIDVVVQPQIDRRKKLFLADMDSTMIGQECIDELADFAGLKAHVAAITERAMRGEIAFEPALRERVALLKGLDTAVVDRIIANRLTLAAGGRALVQTMRANGAWTALVSGGFDVFTSRIAAMLGFQENRANRLVEGDGAFTGMVTEPILGRAAKAEALLDIAKRLGLTTEDAIAVGDGANDLDMIRLAGTGVALHAKPAVAEQARIRIDHGDLTALLYLQGYRQDEFVE